MGIATYKDLCIDTSHSDERLGRFWAAALGLRLESDGAAGRLVGDEPAQRVWMNVVPEPKTTKNRVHLDVHAASTDELVALGAVLLEPAEEYGRPWSVMADPDGGEFCAFVRPPDELPDYRLHEMVIDCVDPKSIAQWWADVFGCQLGGREEKNWWWLVDIPGVPFGDWDFVPVPEPKTVKNRVHWDVLVDSVDDLTAAGATLLRARDDEISWTLMAAPEGSRSIGSVTERDGSEPAEPQRPWTVMQDPEGNEFCAFTRD